MPKPPTVDPSELAKVRICHNCIGEAYLKAEIGRDGQVGQCSTCGSRAHSISIGELADRFKTVLEDHYGLTANEPSAFEYALLKDPETRFDWEREGEPVTDLIADCAQIGLETAEQIREVLSDRYYDFDDAMSGEEDPYGEEAMYEEQGPEVHALFADWSYFRRSLKTESRLFNREAERVLDSIFEGLAEHATHEGKSVVIDAGPGCSISSLDRARVFTGGEETLETPIMRPDKGVGPPPPSAALAGRMNARGISVFYGASDASVALAEVRPPVGSRVVVARFEIVRPLRLLDVEALRKIYVRGSVFDPQHVRRLEKARFLQHLSHEIVMPVMPEDEPTDYLVTQAIADYLANRQDPVIDGIVYPSIQSGARGVNVALFHKSSRVEPLALPKGTTMTAHVGPWMGDDDPYPDYTVWERVPAPDAEADEDDFGPPTVEPDTWRESAQDSRQPALRLSLDSVTVHHVESVTYGSQPYRVSRHRSEGVGPKF